MPIDLPTGHYIEVAPGVELYYEELGSGPPIVFVPGWTFTTEVFRDQLSHFSNRHRVIAIDPRSQGRSSITVDGNAYPIHAADLLKVTTQLGLKDVVFVGWSFGCLETWGYIKLAGTANVKAVVSVDLSPKPLSVNPQDWTEGPLDQIAQIYTSSFTSRQGHRDFITSYAEQVMVQRPLTKEELTWIVEQSLRTPYYIGGALFASGMFADHMAEATLVDKKLPALNVIAEHWADIAVRFSQKHFPKTRTVVLGGHMMFWEHAARFNMLLDEFLESI